MTKVPQEKAIAKFTVKKRTPKPAPDFFQNVTPFTHPIQELLESQSGQALLKRAPDDSSGVRDSKSRTPELKNLGHFDNITSDTHTIQSRTPELKNLGHFVTSISDTEASEIEVRALVNTPISDTRASEIEISDARTVKNFTRQQYDSKYERKRASDQARDRMNLRPNMDLGKQIRVFCAEQSLELTEFFELAAAAFMLNLGRPNLKNSDRKAPYDDRRLMLWKTRPALINLYLRYNPKNKWKIIDDKVAAAYNENDLRIIELGLIQTQFNARFKRINSFSYYVGGIEEWLTNAPGDELIAFLTQHHREQWSKATGIKFENEENTYEG